MADDEIILEDLSDDELVQQMHDDLYDGLKEEIEDGTNILLKRGWAPYDVLTQALVEGMRIVGHPAPAACRHRRAEAGQGGHRHRQG